MIWILSGFATLFSLVSLLHFNTTQSLTLWKLSILATEYGHWLALLGMISLIGLFFLPHLPRVFVSFTVLAISASIGINLLPLAELRSGWPSWSAQLESAFGPAPEPQTPLPDYSLLWKGSHSLRKITPESFVYWKEGDTELSLDFYPSSKPESAPWVMVIHGGGWNGGDEKQLPELNSYLASKGFAVVSIAYRLAPRWKWPAAREDAFRARDFVRSHAKDWGIDPGRWAVLGRSAGGQIAESVAYGSSDPTLKGCIAFYAPADLDFAYKYASEDDILKSPQLLRDYLGGNPTENPDAYQDASPIRFVHSDSPPTLLFHGPRDPLVWHRQSERLLDKLRENHVPSVLISVPWGTHGFDYSLSGPGGQLSTAAIERFLQTVFQAKKGL